MNPGNARNFIAPIDLYRLAEEGCLHTFKIIQYTCGIK